MNQVYSTQALLQILQSERQACLRGERLSLTANASSGHPIIDRFLKTDGIQKYTAYQGFKEAVHNYQREYQVSGVVWQTLSLQGRAFRYPVVDPQLIALPQDLVQLREAKHEVLVFWQEVSQGMELYLAVNRGKDFQAIAPRDVEAIAQRTDWATLQVWQRQDFLELVLQLGWGQPSEADHWRSWPAAGSEYLHAVQPGQKPICS